MKKKLAVVLFAVLMIFGTLVCRAETMNIGETMTFTASDAPTSYAPLGTVSRIHSWYTSDSSIVEIVSYSGYTCTVRAKSSGTVTISNKQSMTYTSYMATGIMNRQESNFGGTWSVTVAAIDPTGISIPSSLSVEAEDSQRLTPIFTPSNASSQLSWKSSDTTVATVEGGTVYGIKPGTATITVTTANGYKDTCKVTVTAPATVLSYVTPENNKQSVALDTKIKFTYNLDIKESTNFSSIKLYDNTAKANVSITKATDGKTVIITPDAPLLQGHSYSATVPSKAVENLYGAKNTEEVQTTFKTVPLKAVSTFPAANTLDVMVDTDISVTFDGAIGKGSRWNNITLKDENGNSVALNKSTSGNTLKLSPADDLEFYTKFTLTVPSGAVTCGGADSEEDVILTFKTCRDADRVYPPEFEYKSGRLYITAEENTSIYYTVDGGMPMLSGQLYTEPIIFTSQNVHVRAIAVRNGRVSDEREYKAAGAMASTFGGSRNDYFYAMIPTEDGYVAAGYSQYKSFGNGDWTGVSGDNGEAIIVKYDNSGNIVWKKNFGADDYDYFDAITATTDGYVAVGHVSRIDGQDDGFIVKCDKNGNLIWKKTFDGNDDFDSFESVIAVSDGYIVVGDSDETLISSGNVCYNTDAIMVKYDTSGNVKWKKFFGTPDPSVVKFATNSFLGVAAADGGYIAVGYVGYPEQFGTGDLTGVTGKGGADAIMVKYNTSGSVVWKKNFGGSGDDYFSEIIKTEDGYVITGNSNIYGDGDWEGLNGKSGKDAIVLKCDENGNIIWKNSFGGDGADYMSGLTATEDGYVIVGNSGAETFGNGDWTGFTAKGEADGIIVKCDKNGNAVWKKNFGGSGDDGFCGVIQKENAYIVAGYATESSFGNGDLSYISPKGYSDAIIVRFLEDAYESDKYISSERGKAAVAGKDRVVKGDEITVPVYFTPVDNVTGVNIKLTYPEHFTYIGAQSEYEDNIYIDSKTGSMVISGDFSADGATLPSDELCVFARLKFSIEPSMEEGNNSVSIIADETFMMNADYEMVPFAKTEDYLFTVSAVGPKAISLTGSEEVTGETQYGVTLFPENAKAEGFVWSVSDESIARVDANGLLIPLKNGEAMLTVKETGTGIEKSITFTVSGLRTSIKEITSDTGRFAKAYKPSETSRILYVPEGTESIKLSVDFDMGSVTGENGIFFKKVAKEIEIGALPYEIALTKKESGYADTIYTIKVIKQLYGELQPDVKVNGTAADIDIALKTNTDADLIIAMYEGNALKSVNIRKCVSGETNISDIVTLQGDKLKIMLFEEGSIKPLCDAYEIKY